jgi:hypothetical protein
MSSAEELMAAARGATGLADFGEDSFRDGLEKLTASLQTEASLSEAGHASSRSRVIGLLSNRLRIEDWIRQHPEVESEEVVAPIVVLGLPRTGSTALASLLTKDPGTRYLRTWESAIPLPPPETATQHDDPRIGLVQGGIDAMNEEHPQWRAMYDASATGSTESQDLLGMAFAAWQFGGDYFIPSYEAWLAECDMESAYRWHERVLKMLQSRCAPNRWMLHSPVHTLGLEGLHRVHPDARFIVTHRDPAKVLGSVCSLIGFRRSLFSEHGDARRLGEQQVEIWVLAMQRAIEFRARHEDACFADLYFKDLLTDPIAAIERSYASLGVEFTAAARDAMADRAVSHPRGRHGEHRYGLEEFGLEASDVRSRFAFYLDRFDIACEQ